MYLPVIRTSLALLKEDNCICKLEKFRIPNFEDILFITANNVALHVSDVSNLKCIYLTFINCYYMYMDIRDIIKLSQWYISDTCLQVFIGQIHTITILKVKYISV